MTDLDRALGGDPEAADNANLNKRMVRGAAWMIALRLANRCVALVSMVVLARLLVPADFGLIALAMAMVGAIDVLGEFGFEMALIQNQNTDRRHYDTVWTLTVLRGLAAGLIILLLADPLAGFFDDPRLADVVMTLAALPFIQGFYNVGTVAFRKDLTLNKEFVFRIVPRLIGVGITITFALIWRNYWALVYGSLVGASLRLIMSYIMHEFRPRFSLAALGEIMDFSKWMLLTSIVAFANQKVDTFIIAKYLDAAAVGTWALSKQIANMASAELIAPIKQALFPGYSKLAHDITLLRKAFLDVFGILVLIALPAALGIGITADIFVPILLGPNWLSTIPLIEILVISGGIRSVTSHVRPIYLAMNRPKYGAYASIGRALVFLPLTFFALQYYGIIGAAIAHAIAQIAVLVGSLYFTHRLLDLSPLALLRACWRPLVACALMIAAVESLKGFAPLADGGIAMLTTLLVAAVALGAAVYVGSLLLLWRLCGAPSGCAESYLLAFIGRRLRRQTGTP